MEHATPRSQTTSQNPRVTEPDLLRLDGFRRTLPDRERRAFDRVLDRARARAAGPFDPPAAGPAQALFLAVLVEQELSIMRVEAAVEELCWTVLGHSSDGAEAR